MIVSFLFVNLFDTAGTLFGVATRANLVEDSGDIKDLDKALKVDSSSSVFGSFLGCAPVTSYVESSAGIEAGGRTGMTAVVVGILFSPSHFPFSFGSSCSCLCNRRSFDLRCNLNVKWNGKSKLG